MHTPSSVQKWRQHKTPSFGLRRFLLLLLFISLVAMVIGLFVLGESWPGSITPEQNPISSPVGGIPTLSPFPSLTPPLSPTRVPTAPPTVSLESRIDTSINHLTPTQQIAQLLMLAVYTNGYTSALNQPLRQWDIANVIMYNQYNGEPLMPTTLAGWTELAHDL